MISNNKIDNYSDKMQKCLDYLESLEEERRKIQVFQRELPLCLDLVSQAIEKCKKDFYSPKQLSGCTDQTSSEGPVLEEFMPIKRVAPSKEDEQHSKKSDWLKSVQLWNQTPDSPTTKEDSPKKVSVVEVNKNGNGGAFHPFIRDDKKIVEAPLAATASSTEETGGSSGGCKVDEREDPQKKARRCWSPELHRRFLQALQQLGGAHVGTPKQIRELMKVDGLTNDEVKSHLQKYRLHTRRPSPSSNNAQAPQFVVVGGIWVPPPPEYTSTAATSDEAAGLVIRSSNGIYAPKATLPIKSHIGEAIKMQRQQSGTNYSDKNGTYSPTRIRSDSPETSSSAHTNTASPEY
ncbi:myb family transcription factor EFM [Heracleum sosnowskyi]|uniref:Myb family transcription factor EFM n=1 Tax=Heracleum sosnowskyi TaxID=360622 RepID=A0AAD8I8E4_9APIA|nr:myb family transcription factor EFM [Heracleum sosnowskyi]